MKGREGVSRAQQTFDRYPTAARATILDQGDLDALSPQAEKGLHLPRPKALGDYLSRNLKGGGGTFIEHRKAPLHLRPGLALEEISRY